MNRLLLLLIYAAALIAGIFIGYFAALEIHNYRAGKKKGSIVMALLAFALAAAGIYVSLLFNRAIYSYAIGIIVGFTPFIHVQNKETDAQIKATNRDRMLREQQREEAKERREEKRKQK